MDGRTHATLFSVYGEQLSQLCIELNDHMEILDPWLRAQDRNLAPETQALIAELVEIQRQLLIAGELFCQHSAHFLETYHPPGSDALTKKYRTKRFFKVG